MICYVTGANAIDANFNLSIRNIDRTVDLASQLVKVSAVVTLENTGSTAVKNYMYVLEYGKENLAFFSAQSGDSRTSLQVSESEDEATWSIELVELLQPGKLTSVEIETVYTHQLVPHPATITQKEKQLVMYHGSHYVCSPYHVSRQTTTINLGSKHVESYTKLKPTSLSDTTITYGPYENVLPNTKDEMAIHYENNAPFLTITNLERVIEVSHWGNIAVEEMVDLLHTGALLKGPFSRYEYQREAHSGLSSIKSFKTVLPAAASDAYYRDEIGNISTSHMKILSDSVELELRPRFPLFGGWRTHYVVGYNVPSYEYLYNSGDNYLLKMRFLDHVFDDMIVDDVTTKIILPEGAHDIYLFTPYSVERLADSLHYTYLDTKGRTVITMRKKNLVENHIQDFKLQYKFPPLLMLLEPFLIIVAFYLLFLLVIIYVRLDFSLTKDEAGESRMRVAGFCEKLLSHQNKRVTCYRNYDEQLAKLKLSKDINAFQASMKNINQEYKSESMHISDILLKLKADAPELSDKLLELQKVDRQLKEVYTLHQNLYVDKLAPGKIVRQQFIDTESQINKKKEDYTDKINGILKIIQ